MRLNAGSTMSGEGPDGPSAEIVETIMGDRKRFRPTSSLDIKVENGHKQTTPPRKHKPVPPPSSHQQQQQQQQQQRSSNARTRARGGGGIPSKYGDEYLRKHHADTKENDAYPDHLRAMMEDGIPIKQWVVLLLLLGAGLYQLRKVLIGPAVAAPDASKKKSPKKLTTKKSKKTSYAQVAAGLSVSAFRSSPSGSSPVSITTDEKTVSSSKEKPQADNVDRSLDNKHKAPAKKKRTKKAAQKKEEQSRQSPATISTDDGSSTAELVAEQDLEDRIATQQSTEPLDHVYEEPVEDDGWHTVGGGNSEKSQPRNGAPAQAEAETKQKHNAKQAQEITAGASTVANPAAEEDAKSPKETIKKMTSATNDQKPSLSATAAAPSPVFVAPPTQEGASTDDDEALALKLQLEEEKLAGADSVSTDKDTWAEVTTKKARRKSTGAD